MYHPPFRYILITKTQCRGLKHVSLLQTCTVPIFSFYTPTPCKNATVHDTDSHVQLASIFSQFNAAFCIFHNSQQRRSKSIKIPSNPITSDFYLSIPHGNLPFSQKIFWNALQYGSRNLPF